MVTIAVKGTAYRSVEIFFNELGNCGESRLGIYGPPGGSEVVFLEQFPDETILRLLPARADAFGQRLSGATGPSAFALLRRLFLSLRALGPLGSVRRGGWRREISVWWYTENLEGRG